jgi:hypothetical protein
MLSFKSLGTTDQGFFCFLYSEFAVNLSKSLLIGEKYQGELKIVAGKARQVHFLIFQLFDPAYHSRMWSGGRSF